MSDRNPGERHRVLAELRNYCADVNARLALWLRAERLARGLTQREIAATLGVTFQQVYKYENGANRLSATSLLILIHELDLDPAEMLATALGDALPRPALGRTSMPLRVARRVAGLTPAAQRGLMALLDDLEQVAGEPADAVLLPPECVAC
jgi:transcriptional regulator with XRE-family HTH domain